MRKIEYDANWKPINGPFISVICPTRMRPEKLKRMVESITSTADDPDNYEIILRVHADDKATIELLPTLLGMGPVYAYIGVPRDYSGNRRAFTEAISVANGRLMWIMNDDVFVEGQGWDTQLKELPEKHLAKPELHQTGLSNYTMDTGVPFYLLPIDSWRKSPDDIFPGEVEMRQRLEADGWETFWLKGIKVTHTWDGNDINKINEGLT